MIFHKNQKFIENYLPPFILGAVDGTVTTFAVIAAAAGAGVSSVVVLILGISNLFADGFSMGSSAYLSDQAENKSRKNHSKISPFSTGVATFFAFGAIGFLPLIPYIIDIASQNAIGSQKTFLASSIITGLSFLLIGYIKGRVTRDRPIKSALITFLLGAIAAGLAYFAGDVLGVMFGLKN